MGHAPALPRDIRPHLAMVWDYEFEYGQARRDPLNPDHIAFHDREDVWAARDAALAKLSPRERADVIQAFHAALSRLKAVYGDRLGIEVPQMDEETWVAVKRDRDLKFLGWALFAIVVIALLAVTVVAVAMTTVTAALL